MVAAHSALNTQVSSIEQLPSALDKELQKSQELRVNSLICRQKLQQLQADITRHSQKYQQLRSNCATTRQKLQHLRFNCATTRQKSQQLRSIINRHFQMIEQLSSDSKEQMIESLPIASHEHFLKLMHFQSDTDNCLENLKEWQFDVEQRLLLVEQLQSDLNKYLAKANHLVENLQPQVLASHVSDKSTDEAELKVVLENLQRLMNNFINGDG